MRGVAIFTTCVQYTTIVDKTRHGNKYVQLPRPFPVIILYLLNAQSRVISLHEVSLY